MQIIVSFWSEIVYIKSTIFLLFIFDEILGSESFDVCVYKYIYVHIQMRKSIRQRRLELIDYQLIILNIIFFFCLI